MKKEINVFDYAETIAKAVEKGVLVTTKNGDKVNSMTISWGMLGIEWGKPLFITFVREGRFTRRQLDATGEFTVNIPLGSYDPKIMGYCGSRTGENIDKLRDLGLTTVEGDEVKAPGIKELPLTLECKVVYKQLQDRYAIVDKFQEFYPSDVPSTNPMGNKDYHIAFYGEIVKAYIIE